jgi:hypothetical protein
MAPVFEVTVRRARRDDIGSIIAMLADDPLGGPRERLEDPLPQAYFQAFERLERDPNINLVVAEAWSRMSASPHIAAAAASASS